MFTALFSQTSCDWIWPSITETTSFIVILSDRDSSACQSQRESETQTQSQTVRLMVVTDRRGRQAPSDNQTPAHSCRPVHTGAISKWLASITWQGSLLERFYRLTLGKRGRPSVCLAWGALVWLSPQRAHLPRMYHSSVYTTWRIGNAW